MQNRIENLCSTARFTSTERRERLIHRKLLLISRFLYSSCPFPVPSLLFTGLLFVLCLGLLFLLLFHLHHTVFHHMLGKPFLSTYSTSKHATIISTDFISSVPNTAFITASFTMHFLSAFWSLCSRIYSQIFFRQSLRVHCEQPITACNSGDALYDF